MVSRDRSTIIGSVISADALLNGFRRCWRRLAAVDIGWNLLGLLILGPLAGLIFRAVLSLSGKTVLADEEIAYFFLTSPAGWAGILILGAVFVGLMALNQVALMSVVRDDRAGHSTEFRRAVSALRCQGSYRFLP